MFLCYIGQVERLVTCYICFCREDFTLQWSTLKHFFLSQNMHFLWRVGKLAGRTSRFSHQILLTFPCYHRRTSSNGGTKRSERNTTNNLRFWSRNGALRNKILPTISFVDSSDCGFTESRMHCLTSHVPKSRSPSVLDTFAIAMRVKVHA